ncbi:MAG: trypsin-like serine protease [Cytophagales bacterium]|nr:trypsin-like serine protease [Cytophagales bacterium]
MKYVFSALLLIFLLLSTAYGQVIEYHDHQYTSPTLTGVKLSAEEQSVRIKKLEFYRQIEREKKDTIWISSKLVKETLTDYPINELQIDNHILSAKGYDIASSQHDKDSVQINKSSLLNYLDTTIFYLTRGFKKMKNHQVQLRHQFQHSGVDEIQIEFDSTKTNIPSESFMILYGEFPQDFLILDSVSIRWYKYRSIFFRGTSITLECYINESDKNMKVSVKRILTVRDTSEKIHDSKARVEKISSICGQDERELTTDRAVGRLTGGTCTGFILSNGILVTAGHCRDLNSRQIVFNRPSNGTSHVNAFRDTYTIVANLFEDASGVYTTKGDDHAVFLCARNAFTGRLPGEAQQAFFRASRDHEPDYVRITGYGRDDEEEKNKELQTDRDRLLEEVRYYTDDCIWWNHIVDTESGNSGSPIFTDNSSRIAIGVHTYGGLSCAWPTVEPNAGESFESNDFEQDLNHITSLDIPTKVVDHVHYVNHQEGTVLRPYRSVAAAVASSSTSTPTRLQLVTGNYAESVVIDRPILFDTPVGPVTIGRGAGPGRLPSENYLEFYSPFSQPKRIDTTNTGPSVESVMDEPSFNLHPNPCSDILTVELSNHTKDVYFRLLLLDQLGRTVLEKDLKSRGEDGKVIISVQSYSSGIYHLFWKEKEILGRK